jgi:hypothetical protein
MNLAYFPILYYPLAFFALCLINPFISDSRIRPVLFTYFFLFFFHLTVSIFFTVPELDEGSLNIKGQPNLGRPFWLEKMLADHAQLRSEAWRSSAGRIILPV